jgi:hypothetical protein
MISEFSSQMETPNTKKGFYHLFSIHAKLRKQQNNGILQGMN